MTSPLRPHSKAFYRNFSPLIPLLNPDLPAPLQRAAQKPLDGVHHGQVIWGNERNGSAQLRHPTGATDPVGISHGRIGHIVVDHMRDLGDIDAPRCDIRGHHHLNPAAAEAVHRLLAPVL